MRRLFVVLIVLVVVALAWTAGWFALAAWVDGSATTALARLQDRGLTVTCEARRVTGFPFALRVACGEATVAERRTGGAARLGGATAGASIFSPMTAKVALASPAHVESPLMPGPAEARWTGATVSVGLGMDGPRSLSFGADDLAANSPGLALTAKRVGGLLTPDASGGTAATLSFAGLALSRGAAAFPAVDGHAFAQLPMPPRALLAGARALRPPFALHGLNATLASGAVRMQTEGDISVDADGVVDAAITLRIAGADSLPGLIAALPAEDQKIGNAVAGALLAFGRPTTLDGAPASELLVEVKRGKARVGPVEVRVPRFPLR